jgi:phospholipid/cholesterol/gamma-HCH transport system substrate-binding protein/cholesterol transport system auxiliary component
MTIASALRFTALGLLIALSGCSVLSSQPPSTTYDFGPLAAAPSQPPPVAKAAHHADRRAGLDGRQRHLLPAPVHAGAAAAGLLDAALGRLPQHLFNDRLRDAVAARGPLSWSGDTTIPALKVDLLAFEQVFDSPTSSRGVVRARATVYHKGLIGQKTFVAEQPAPSADGQGGVKALSAGVDAVIAAILDWTATLPLDGTQASTAPPAPQRR